MKSVAVVCLSLCLWANVGAAGSVWDDKTWVERLFNNSYYYKPSEGKNQFAPNVLAEATRCIEYTVASADPVLLQSVYEFIVLHEECKKAANESVGNESDRIEREETLRQCLESFVVTTFSPELANIKSFGETIDACVIKAMKEIGRKFRNAAAALGV